MSHATADTLLFVFFYISGGLNAYLLFGRGPRRPK